MANQRGNIMVKLLIGMITVSVIATAMMNVRNNAQQQVSYQDLSRLMSMRAKNAFDKIGYHFKLAGYANSNNQKSVDIRQGDESDTLVIWHNNVEIIFFVDLSDERGILYESIDGSLNKIIEDVESLQCTKLTNNCATLGITFNRYEDKLETRIIARTYSRTIKLKNFL